MKNPLKFGLLIQGHSKFLVMPEQITLLLAQYEVKFEVPDGSEQRGREPHRRYIVLPGDKPRVMYGEILLPYPKITDIK